MLKIVTAKYNATFHICYYKDLYCQSFYRLGLDPKLCSQVLNISSGRCWSSDTYNPCPGVMEGVPSSRNYEGGFGTALMRKDLNLAQNAAINTKSITPMGSLALHIYNLMCQNGYDSKDFSSVYKFLEEK